MLCLQDQDLLEVLLIVLPSIDPDNAKFAGLLPGQKYTSSPITMGHDATYLTASSDEFLFNQKGCGSNNFLSGPVCPTYCQTEEDKSNRLSDAGATFNDQGVAGLLFPCAELLCIVHKAPWSTG